MEYQSEEYFKVLVHSYLSNQASEKEIEELQYWIFESEENRKKFKELKEVWFLTSQAPPRGRFNKAKYDEWKQLSVKLVEGDQKVPLSSVTSFQKFVRIAAALLLFFSIGSTLAWRINANRYQRLVKKELTTQILVPKGSKTEVILPDGTKVNLNAGSNLVYHGDFGASQREVYLTGEGYFEVASDPGKPFIVEALGLKIKALGTVFNVKAYPEENAITTTLVDGLVKVEGAGVNLTMTPRQKITYIKSAGNQIPDEDDKAPKKVKPVTTIQPDVHEAPPKINIVSNINTQSITSWKEGRLIFKTEKLSSLIVLLERKFDVSIKIESEELLNYTFTGTFHLETLEQILHIINLSAPIKYEIEKGQVTIQPDPKRRHVFKEVLSN